mmetsp:Transcript_12951/g.25322  ORF Transcript_12951/g.25322 Transcript_12951/m.25322 type:complete len:112 (+) Transcript_12951:121-456(+)
MCPAFEKCRSRTGVREAFLRQRHSFSMEGRDTSPWRSSRERQTGEERENKQRWRREGEMSKKPKEKKEKSNGHTHHKGTKWTRPEGKEKTPGVHPLQACVALKKQNSSRAG